MLCSSAVCERAVLCTLLSLAPVTDTEFQWERERDSGTRLTSASVGQQQLTVLPYQLYWANIAPMAP